VRIHIRYGVGVALLLAAATSAQVSSNQALSGKYYFRQMLLLTDGTANIVDVRSASGTLTFDGNGNVSMSGQQLVGTAPPAALAISAGNYAVKPGGFVTLPNPLRAGATVNARLGLGALVGSSTEAGSTVFDMLVAISAPAQPVSNSLLSGPYWVSSLELPNASAAYIRDANVKLTADGAGGFKETTVTGQANNLGNALLSQTTGPMTYGVAPDGTGNLLIAPGTGLNNNSQVIEGSKNMYFSADGNYFIGGSTAAGGHGLVVGVRAYFNGATNASWNGLYFAAGMRYDTAPPRLASVVGSVNATSLGSVWSRRTRQSDGLFDATPLITYALGSDGGGNYTSAQGKVDVAVNGQTFATSGVDVVRSSSYELYFGVRMPPQSGTGVFLHPQGIYSAASFAPAGAPVSPGEFVTLFGSGFPAQSSKAAIPFPTTLGTVQVTVNGTAAPVYAVSSAQISAVVPNGVTGQTATFVVTVGGVKSNAVDVPLALTSPGIFSLTSNGLGDGAILHADYSVVNHDNPALPGEIVQVFLTGLGATSPVVSDGASAPTKPLATVSGPVNVYVGGSLVTNIQFKGLTPGLASLYQLNVQIPANMGPGWQDLAVQTADGFTDLVNVWVGSQ
jgi:uncharacterized protein (TIGR03437 family)